ncbi:MAG: 50S ribosomal protein L10 [Desulfococcus sp.]|nr:MAG: 50S ribosomal protein L10 [Desulfococcus sp.]
MIIDRKQEIVSDIHEKFEKSKIVIATDYKGLDVAAMTDLRAKLREADIEYRVVKNTLLVRAARDTGAESLIDSFKGPTAIAMSFDDPVAPAKVLTEFAKENGKLEIKSAVMEGKMLDLDGVKALSSLPPRDVLLAQALSTMNAVSTSFVRLLNAVPQSLVYALSAIREKKESPAA